MITKQGFITHETHQNAKELIIGPFHYESVNLETVKNDIDLKTLNSGIISFYIPPKDLTYENDKVITRWLWSSGKDEYTIFSDIVPMVIHSSRYLPRKNPKQFFYGVIVNFRYLQKKVSKLEMKRKNGIRSRFSSKETCHLVQILDIAIINTEEDFPTQLFQKTADWVSFCRKINLQIGVDCSKNALFVIKKKVNDLNNPSVLEPRKPPLTRAKSRELHLIQKQHIKKESEKEYNSLFQREEKKHFIKNNKIYSQLQKKNKDKVNENVNLNVNENEKENEKEREKEEEKNEKKETNKKIIQQKTSFIHNLQSPKNEKKTPLLQKNNNQGSVVCLDYKVSVNRKRSFEEGKYSSQEMNFDNNFAIMKNTQEPNHSKQREPTLKGNRVGDNHNIRQPKFSNGMKGFYTQNFSDQDEKKKAKNYLSKNKMKMANPNKIKIEKKNFPSRNESMTISIFLNKIHNYPLGEISRNILTDSQNILDILKTHVLFFETLNKRYEISFAKTNSVKLCEVRKPKPLDLMLTIKQKTIPNLSKDVIILKHNLELEQIHWFEHSILFQDLMVQPLKFFFLEITQN
ncbi:hypothetical protein M0813_23129 [Anaeramoeba flamelloides]|uniref:Uncharacterized protein n=1 Tax=Anaeramoeba flamelloides TaxID=1746091 RepID=A0ABQ8YBP7_9EUKA|nr:hypothetical protein M0813_23129 [Anaeramoeba flamelloides]